MKRITLFLLGIVLMSTVACGRTNSNANSDRVTAAEDSKAKVIHLTKAEFLEKVYNFEKNPDEWKYDTDKETELARAFGIRSIPSILFIPMNGKPEMAQGALPKEAFKKAIDELLLKK